MHLANRLPACIIVHGTAYIVLCLAPNKNAIARWRLLLVNLGHRMGSGNSMHEKSARLCCFLDENAYEFSLCHRPGFAEYCIH